MILLAAHRCFRVLFFSIRGSLLLLACGWCSASATEPAGPGDPDPVLRSGCPSWVETLEWSAEPIRVPAGAPAEIILSDQQDRLTPDGSDFYFHLVVRLAERPGRAPKFRVVRHLCTGI